jgi:hypothetical protein
MSSPSDALPRKAREPAGALPWLVMIYIVVTVGRIGDIVPVLSNLPLARIVAALGIFVALRTRSALAPVRLATIGPARMTIWLMILVTVSILFSVLRSATFGVITGTVLAVSIGLFLAVKASRSWRAIRVMLLGNVVAAAWLAGAAMTTTFSHRAGSISSYDPNDFAYVLVGLLPVVVTFGIVSSGVKRMLFFGVSVWMIFAILLTQSRGGLLGLLCIAVLMGILLPVRRAGVLSLQPSIGNMIARILVMCSVAVIIWHWVPTDARERLVTVFALESDYNVSGDRGGRFAIWTRNMPLFFARPWGYGAGAFGTVDGMYAGGRFRAAHNTYLQCLIELGLPGLLLFLSVIVRSWVYLRTTSAREVGTEVDASRLESRAFGRALGVSLAGLCVAGFFLSELYSTALWMVVALICAVGAGRRLWDPSSAVPGHAISGTLATARAVSAARDTLLER